MGGSVVATTIQTWVRHGSGKGHVPTVAPPRGDGRATWRLTKVAAIAAAVLGLDQVSKAIVRLSMPLCTAPHAIGCERVRLPGSAGLLRAENPGGALGFGMSMGSMVWTSVALLGLALVISYARKGRLSPILALGMALQLGAVLGNLMDRLAFGAVTDFIYLTRGLLFNVADLALAVGSLLAFVALASTRVADPAKRADRR